MKNGRTEKEDVKEEEIQRKQKARNREIKVDGKVIKQVFDFTY